MDVTFIFTLISLMFPILVVGILTYVVYTVFRSYISRKNKSNNEALKQMASSLGAEYQQNSTANLACGVFATNTESTQNNLAKQFNAWLDLGNFTPQHIISGRLTSSKNHYRQFILNDIVKQGKHSKTISRTILEVDIPNTRTQIIIDSRINDVGKEDEEIKQFKIFQEYTLSGDFSDYFRVLVPENLELDLLTYFDPDVLESLMRHFGDFDIEVTQDKLLVYYFGELSAEMRKYIIQAVDVLLWQMRLRQGDAKVKRVQDGTISVARSASTIQQSSQLKRKPAIASAVGIVIFILLYTNGYFGVSTFIIVGFVWGLVIFRLLWDAGGELKQRQLRKKLKARNASIQMNM